MGAVHAFAARRKQLKRRGEKEETVQYQSNLGGYIRKTMLQLRLCSVENVPSTLQVTWRMKWHRLL